MALRSYELALALSAAAGAVVAASTVLDGTGVASRHAQGQPAASATNAAPTSMGPPVGYFEASADIGSPAIAGSTTYDAAAQAYTLSAGGANMWFSRDEFQFAWRRMRGEGSTRNP